MASEMWFKEYERLLNQKIDEGKKYSVASEEAATEAAPLLWERMADMADIARKIAKGE
jgi:cytochrome c556